jgi:type IV pilus assembly protein PilM
MGGTVVGVDIGSASIRAVEVQGYDGPKPTILRYAEMVVPENSVRRGEVVERSTVSTALKRLWIQGGFKTKNVVLGIGGSRVFARDFTVPRASSERMRESLPFLVQDLLPVPVSDVILDFYPISEETGESGPLVNGMLVAGLQEAVSANVAATLDAGLHPQHVDLIPFAVTRALSPIRSARGREALIAIGANTTNVVVVHDGVPHFVRMIPNGGDDLTRTIASRLQWDPTRAEEIKRVIGMGGPMIRQEDRPVLEIIYEVVGELLSNIRSTLSYYASSKPSAPVQRIVLSGGGAQLNGLPNALAELTGLPVALAEPFTSVATAKTAKPAGRAEQDAYTTAYGLALGSHA